MNNNEVVIVDGINPVDYNSIIAESVRYSIISLPFTIDRMKIPDERKRALNIAKGKAAEELFKYFCLNNSIDMDFDICSTPFWTVDNRDFVLNNSEWDIKNNFIYSKDSILKEYNYIDLPALVPNRHKNDQWSKRDILLLNNTKKVEFLFTFLKNADLIDGKRGTYFLDVILTSQQQEFLRDLYNKFKGLPQDKQPYSEEWFWQEMGNRGGDNYFRLNFMPYLVITGYANLEHWSLFKDTGPFDRNNNLQTYKKPRWYHKSSSGSCNFLNGTLWTTITNSTTPISKLPSFLSLFPHLSNNIVYGRLNT